MAAVTAAKQQTAGFRDDVPFSGAFDRNGIGFTSHRPKRLDRSYVVRADLFFSCMTYGNLSRTLLCVMRFYRRSRALLFPRLKEKSIEAVVGDTKTNSATIAVALLALMLSGTALAGEQTAAPAQTTTTTDGATSAPPGPASSAQPSAAPKNVHPVSQMGLSLDAALLEDRTPLVTQGLQLIPSGSDQFKKTERAAFYVEIYAPALVGLNPPKVGIQMIIVDRKTGEKKIESGGAAADAKAGSPLVPLGLRLPVNELPPGSYRLELKAVDSAGNVTQPRTADFEVQ